MSLIEGDLSANGFRFAVVLSRFNSNIGSRLLAGTTACLKEYGCPEENIDIIKVPGAFEIPSAAAKLAENKKYNAIICLGAVIRGGTPHFEYVAGSAAAGILNVSVESKIPVIFGVLTTDNYQQAEERSVLDFENLQDPGQAPEGKQPGSGNKGWDAALTAIEMASLFKKLGQK